MNKFVGQISELLKQMQQDFLEKFSKLEDNQEKLDKKVENLDKKFEGKYNELNASIEEMKNRQFLFEEEYGQKIDIILDSVKLEMDKNLEKSQKIRKLDDRMDRTEVNIFGHEKRISSLEINS